MSQFLIRRRSISNHVTVSFSLRLLLLRAIHEHEHQQQWTRHIHQGVHVAHFFHSLRSCVLRVHEHAKRTTWQRQHKQ